MECSYCRHRPATKNVSLQKCTQCKKVSYCNRQCQTAHWKFHKKTCTPYQDANKASIIQEIKQSLSHMDIVLHCSTASSENYPMINSYMGVYTPAVIQVGDGDSTSTASMPVWKRKETECQIISTKANNTKFIDETGLVFSFPPSLDESYYLTIRNNKWIIGLGENLLTVTLKSVKQPGKPELRLAHYEEEEDYFKKHNPLFMFMTNTNFFPWVVTQNDITVGAVSVALAPAIFVTHILEMSSKQDQLSDHQQHFHDNYHNKNTSTSTTDTKKAASQRSTATRQQPPSNMELWSRDVIISIGIITDKDASFYSDLVSIVNRLSAVYSPTDNTNGNFPIWKKKMMKTSDVEEELYLYVKNDKCWCVSSVTPENVTNDNDDDDVGVLLQSKRDITKNEMELAKLAHKHDSNNGRLDKIPALKSSLCSISVSANLSEEVEVWISPYNLWDLTTTISSFVSDDDGAATNLESTDEPISRETLAAPAKRVPECSREFAEQACSRIYSKLNINISVGMSSIFSSKLKTRPVNEFSLEELLGTIFDTASCNWLQVNDSVTAPILEVVFKRRKEFGLDIDMFDSMLHKISTEKRIKDMTALVSSGVSVTTDLLVDIFQDLPKGTNNQFANKLALEMKVVVLKSKADFKRVVDIATGKLGKGPYKGLSSALQNGWEALKSSGMTKSSSDTSQPRHVDDAQEEEEGQTSSSDESIDIGTGLVVPRRLEKHHAKIDDLLKWYEQALVDCKDITTTCGTEIETGDTASETSDEEDETTVEDGFVSSRDDTSSSLLSSEQISLEIEECSRLPSEEEQDKFLDSVERRIDLKSWDVDSVEFPVMITDQAHKWFQRRVKKHSRLCERVIRRLRLLATGRRSYVLCKPLHTNNSTIKLYESKIDKARRIIWEDALAFSPRRSSEGNNFAENGIRVWDIVEDHDNLTRAINLTIERIEKSHTRGLRCMLFTELMNAGDICETTNNNDTEQQHDSIMTSRCYPMREAIRYTPLGPEDKSVRRLNHPANEDEKQYNLLKFYELNYELVRVILDKEDSQADLPFVPGPKENEIINYNPIPKRSLLLMGRSGTGKTTCLVFRMWSRFMAYQKTVGIRPKMLFMTKSEMLKTEVEKSFRNMGVAWYRRSKEIESLKFKERDEGKGEVEGGHPLFVTSSEWLDALDRNLPGEPFFTSKEAKLRVAFRRGEDSVRRTVDALLGPDKGQSEQDQIKREEMTYSAFRKLWPKINAKEKSKMDAALAWLEIKSYIKGSLDALQLCSDNRDDPRNRYLSEEQYLALPKKQSKLDERQKKEVYPLYLSYEKIKKAENRYDEMDLVYNLVGRAVAMRDGASDDVTKCSLFEIDCIFVDEVQDFTVAELYLLTKLARDPDNVMLAGDTAQSVAVGVGFRFEDVRQIFWEKFGHSKPELLPLYHNYRSHAGVLRLAASVLELLYFYFDTSVDKMPPDQGLFDGPRPVIMDASDISELVLILEGSKRETARIEFGAHQVVIVRNEEAKEKLPAQFNVDKEWIMTVQQSKGLEFDDVLLYNFFTDSEANDMWRVITSYTKEEMEKHHADMERLYHSKEETIWDEKLELGQTRPLEFSREKHKILDSELKMLYTAITRARVNVFIAESDTKKCAPMINYFMRRQVVDDMKKAMQDKSANLRVFGNTSTTEDWQKQGETYLQKAHGDQTKRMLNLAMKCFENADDTKRRDHTKAYISFLEAKENFDYVSLGKRVKTSKVKESEDFYKIAFQLLEAEDAALLKMAAECLLRIGNYEYIHAARMLELHASLSYAQNNRPKVIGKKSLSRSVAPSSNEQSLFELAAKLFDKLMNDSKQNPRIYRMHLVDVIRNYLCTGLEEYIMVAADLVESNPDHNLYMFNELQLMLSDKPLDERDLWLDPIMHFRRMMREKQVECRDFTEAFSKISAIACRHYYRKSDQEGLSNAVNAIINPSERILMLKSLEEEDASSALKSVPWAKHPAFSSSNLNVNTQTKLRSQKSKSKIDLSKFIIDELASTGDFQQAGELLEKQGDLLGASNNYSKVKGRDGRDEPFALVKSFICRVRFVDLALMSCGLPELSDKEFLRVQREYLQSPVNLSYELLPSGTKASSIISNARLAEDGGSESFWKELSKSADRSIFWLLEGLKSLLLTFNYEGLMTRSNNLGGDFWQRSLNFLTIVCDAHRAINALLHPTEYRSQEQRFLVAQVESFFELQSDSVNMFHVLTNNTFNLRLRESLREEHIELSALTILAKANSFVSTLDRRKLHPVLAQHLCYTTAKLLLGYEQWLSEVSAIRSVDIFQVRVVFLDKIRKLCCYKGVVELKPWWLDQLILNVDDKMVESIALVFHFLKNTHGFSHNALPSDDIVWNPDFLSVLKREVQQQIGKYEISQKKEDINKLIVLWRLVHLSSGHKYAMQIVEKYLSDVEHHPTIAVDIKHNKVNHILPQRGKLNARDALSIGRLWSWALDYIHRDQPDLIVAIKLICHLQWKVNVSRNLKLIDDDVQLTLIEANVAGLLGCLSCHQYSTDKRDKLWLVMPEHSYVDSYLDGVNSFYGRPLCETIPTTVEAHYSEFAEVFGGFLQAICSIILDMGILSRKDPEKNEALTTQYERVLCLSLIISVNAIAIHNVGQNGSSYGSSSVDLPLRKLDGCAIKLMKELFDVLFQKKSCPRHIQKFVSATAPEKVSVVDLFRMFQSVLEAKHDNLISFCVDKDGFIEKRPFDASHISERKSLKQFLVDDEFNIGVSIPSKKTSVTFANEDNLVGVATFKVFGLSQKLIRDSGVLLTLDELEYLGREVKQQRSACSIQNLWRYHKDEKFNPAVFLLKFRRFKKAFTLLVRQIKRTVVCSDSFKYDDQDDPQNGPIVATFASTENLWSKKSLKRAYDRWRPVVNTSNALFDGIECTYCSPVLDPKAVLNPKKRQERINWCKIQCENESYYMAAKQFNFKHFGAPLAPFKSEKEKKEHEHSDAHKKNVADYTKLSNERKINMCKTLALLDCSIAMMQKVIYVSQEREESNPWYLGLQDEGYSLQVKLEASLQGLRKVSQLWPYPKNIDVSLEEAAKLFENAQTFFNEKAEQENEQACA